jgi:hypothetical protein
MVPYSGGGRVLVIIDGKSKLNIINLDRCFGGNGQRASISSSVLRDTVQDLLGIGLSDDKLMSVTNGWRTGYFVVDVVNVSDEILFHHSLVIAVCSRARHKLSMSNNPNYFIPLNSCEVFDMTVDNPGSSTNHVKMTLDLHTSTALIGRDDLEITLGRLGLQHEAIDGIVNIYAVVRPIDNTKSTVDIGKDAVFRFEKSWVRPWIILIVATSTLIPRAKTQRVFMLLILIASLPRSIRRRRGHIKSKAST